jgi:hypothetical protein
MMAPRAFASGLALAAMAAPGRGAGQGGRRHRRQDHQPARAKQVLDIGPIFVLDLEPGQ